MIYAVVAIVLLEILIPLVRVGIPILRERVKKK
jgi:hypothetical protein